MDFQKWYGPWLSLLFPVIVFIIFMSYDYWQNKQLKELEQRLQNQKRALDDLKRSRTPQECLDEYKSNPDHKYLTRSERRRRERLLEKRLKKTWRPSQEQERSRSHSIVRDPVNRGHPALKQFSRINRQLPQLTLPEFRIIWHQLHLLYEKLCRYTALPFLTFYVFCLHLQISLTGPLLPEPEEESDDTEF